MAALRADGKLRLRLMLPHGELPQWLGEALTGLASEATWSIQVRRSLDQVPAPLRAGALDRWWRRRLRSLHRWNGARWARDPLLAWVGDDGTPDVVLLLDPLTPLAVVDRRGCEADAQPGPSTDSRQPADNAAPRTVWLLCDGHDRALSPLYPLLEDVAGGQGLQLQLLARHGGGNEWLHLRRLHRACDASYGEGLAGLGRAAHDLLRQALLAHEAGRLAGRLPVPRPPAVPHPPTAPAWPLGWVALLHGLRGRWRAWRARQKALWFSDYWRVGLIDTPIAGLLTQHGPLPTPRWITPSSRFGCWADPFGLPGDAQRLVCELFDERTGVGHLEVLTLDGDDQLASRTRLSVGAGRHVSFPNVFELDGHRLGLAESVATRECVLHEVDADGAWRPMRVLLHDVAAADPALFVWEGRYWLAFTDADLGEMDNLCLYHAERLDGAWRPHERNPVKIDIRGARLAGAPFWHAGELYRPAQDCLRSPGAAVVLHRIVTLTPDCFEELEVGRLDPDPQGECPDGLHTLTGWGERTLVDGKRQGLNLRAIGRKLQHRRLRRQRPGGLAQPFAPTTLPAAAGERRLLVYLPSLRRGGGETSMLRLAAGLANEGLAVELVVHELFSSDLLVPPTVRVTSLQAGSTAAALLGLVRRIRASRPHWVVSAFPHNNVAAVLAVLLSGSRARCVITEHAPLSRQIEQRRQWRYRILPPLVRWAYRRAHAVVAVSAGVRDELQRMIGAGVAPVVIYNPVLPANLDAELARVPDHPWLLDQRLQVVLSVSRLSREKDLPALLRAFVRVHRARPQARLLMVGDGPERERLEGLVAQLGLQAVVQLPGATDFPLRWMRHAAVLALSSLYEGFGNVLVEALACGTPVVSTDCPVGPREVLEDGRLGTLVPPGDEAALAAAIRAALSRGRLLPSGAQETARRYTQAAACRAYQRLLEALYPTDPAAC